MVDKKYFLSEKTQQAIAERIRQGEEPNIETSYAIDANYHKGGGEKNFLDKKRRQLVITEDPDHEYRFVKNLMSQYNKEGLMGFTFTTSIKRDLAKGICILEMDKGFIIYRTKDDHILLDKMAVVRNLWGSGIAHGLMNKLKSIAKKENKPIIVRVMQTNKRAIAFYKKTGFSNTMAMNRDGKKPEYQLEWRP